MAGFESAGGGGSPPGWQRDGDKSVSNATSISYTLSETYDVVEVDVSVISSSTFVGQVTANGDTGANYDWTNLIGSGTSGASAVSVVGFTGSGGSGTFRMSGTWESKWTVGPEPPAEDYANVAFVGENATVSSPLSSFELSDSAGRTADSIKLVVRGRTLT